MFKPPSDTQKNQTKPQNSIAFFFRIEPRSCAARDFGMLSYSKLCKGLTKTSWIFFSTTLDRRLFWSEELFFFIFFKAKILSSSFINQCWTILRTISGSKYGDNHGVIVLAVQIPCWTCDFERSKCWGQFQTILTGSFLGYLKQPVLCFWEVLELVRVVRFESPRGWTESTYNLSIQKKTARLSNPIVLINHLDVSGQES